MGRGPVITVKNHRSHIYLCMTPAGVQYLCVHDSCRSQVFARMTPVGVKYIRMTPAGVKYLCVCHM